MTEKYSQKWTIASFFEHLSDGYVFHRSEVPLHATLAGVFAIDVTGDKIANLLKTHLQDVPAFHIVGGEETQWGDVKVRIINKSIHLNALFNGIQKMLLSHGATFNEPEYIGEGFTPHVTKQKSGWLQNGESRIVNSVSVVDMFPDGDYEKRRITATVGFHS